MARVSGASRVERLKLELEHPLADLAAAKRSLGVCRLNSESDSGVGGTDPSNTAGHSRAFGHRSFY